MNLRSIDLNLLPVLEAVYAERSLTRASETLNITQPAVSNALTRLRSHFEDPLFVRDGRGMKPTAMTEALMPVVRDSLDRLRAGLEPRSAFDPSRSTRVFNIAARDFGAFLIAPILAKCLETDAAGIRITWSEVRRTAISTELASGRLDLAIDIGALHGPDLEQIRLFAPNYVCVLAASHPLAEEELTLERFLKMRHVVVSSRREGRSLTEEMVRAAGHRITPSQRLPQHQPALEVVRQTDMVLVAPQPMAEASGLKIHPLPFDYPPLESVLYWRRETADDLALTWLRNLIQDITADL